jgi:hypothetical protein
VAGQRVRRCRAGECGDEGGRQQGMTHSEPPIGLLHPML